MTKRPVRAVLVCLVAVFAGVAAVADPVADAVKERRGLVLHVGCPSPIRPALLSRLPGVLVHGLARAPDELAAVRRHIRVADLAPRLSASLWEGGELPFVDSLVNVLIVESGAVVTEAELDRVLAPGGVLFRRQGGGWRRTVKPWPAELDGWTHSYYGPTNNPVSRDTRVGPPRQTRWIADPVYAKHHEYTPNVAMVVADAGRLFSVVDEAPIASMAFPSQWALVARDAFSGVALWRRPLASWMPRLRLFRTGPYEAQKRLIAADGCVYTPLALGGPVHRLDAATGETLSMYAETAGAREMVYCDGVLYVLTGDPATDRATRLATPKDAPAPSSNRALMAIRAESGHVLWSSSAEDAVGLQPATLCTDGALVCLHNGKDVVCLDAAGGAVRWRTPLAFSEKQSVFSIIRLILHDEVVLCAGRADRAGGERRVGGKKLSSGAGWYGQLHVLARADGRPLWDCDVTEGFTSPFDVFVADGLVWAGQTLQRYIDDFTVGRDPVTGKIKRTISAQKAFTTAHHHRCYPNKATDRFIIMGRRGIECIDLQGGPSTRDYWVRGICQFGVLPANGMIYVPPHSCNCFIESKLNGFLALAPASGTAESWTEGAAEQAFVKGPAYGQEPVAPEPDPAGSVSDSWPTYRHDSARSGCSRTALPATLEQRWRRTLGRRLTAPVVAAGRLFVGAAEEGVLRVLAADTGKPVWSFAVSGRIQAPPTIADGMAVLTASDGWVYCLRAADGVLVWKRHPGPRDRRLVAFGQLESVWPVHGGPLVLDGSVYCVAGRSSNLDGGMVACRLNLQTGAIEATRRFPRSEAAAADGLGILPDVLQFDGGRLHMGPRSFNTDWRPIAGWPKQPRLYAQTGFLDDQLWHRSCWYFSKPSGKGKVWYHGGRSDPLGRLLVFDDEHVYGFGRRPEYVVRFAASMEYELYAASKTQRLPAPKKKVKADPFKNIYAPFRYERTWSTELPLHVHAMVLTAGKVIVAGTPDPVDEKPALGIGRGAAGDLPEAQRRTALEAFQGRQGGVLQVYSKAGEKLAERTLKAPPRFDGMAAAGGALFLACTDGSLVCLAGRPDSGPQ